MDKQVSYLQIFLVTSLYSTFLILIYILLLCTATRNSKREREPWRTTWSNLAINHLRETFQANILSVPAISLWFSLFFCFRILWSSIYLHAANSGRSTRKVADSREKMMCAETVDKLAQMSVSSGTQPKSTRLPPPPPPMKAGGWHGRTDFLARSHEIPSAKRFSRKVMGWDSCAVGACWHQGRRLAHFCCCFILFFPVKINISRLLITVYSLLVCSSCFWLICLKINTMQCLLLLPGIQLRMLGECGLVS